MTTIIGIYSIITLDFFGICQKIMNEKRKLNCFHFKEKRRQGTCEECGT